MSEKPLINLTIDDIPISVPKGTTVYHAAKQLGVHLPIFCYQDRMPPFGACRVCLVEVEKMGKLQTSCTLEATEGMVVRTEAKLAVDGRREILEFLLINHPLDCPICDRGGECPLQDQALEFGPGISRFYEEKRHFKKPYSLGPVLKLDRERCIACARCTRFGDIVAGDHALEFIDRGYKTEVGTPDGGPAKSKFIGNTIQICPVGALTSDVYRFRARPWDNKPTPSTCTLCPVGCSMILDSRDGEIVRTRSCENREVNDIWLCDKGWFGYEFSSSRDRLKTPLVRKNGELQPVSWNEALALIADKVNEAKPQGKIAALGGDCLTVEENYLFQKLVRESMGSNHIDHRVGMPITGSDIEYGMEISIGECEELSYAILLGCDITEEFPIIWLRLKAAINKGAKVLFFGHYAPEIAKYLEKTILHAPGQELETILANKPQLSGKGALFVGRQYLASYQHAEVLKELERWKESIPDLSLNLMMGRGNSMGARFSGMEPSHDGLNAIQIIEEAAKSAWDFLYIAGCNAAVKYPQALWNEARKKLKFLVVQDLFLTETARLADVVLPTLSYVEKSGSFINIEGRVQKINPGKEIPNNLLSDGEIFFKLAFRLAHNLTLDLELPTERLKPKLHNLHTMNISTDTGMKATFSPKLIDHGVRMKRNEHLVQLASAPVVRIHPNDGLKVKDNSSILIRSKNGSLKATVCFDKTVAKNCIVIPLGFDEIPVYELEANLINGLPVEITSCQ